MMSWNISANTFTGSTDSCRGRSEKDPDSIQGEGGNGMWLEPLCNLASKQALRPQVPPEY